MSRSRFPPIMVMGVSGSGKTTIGTLLASELGVPFLDADDLHLPANKEKMRSGQPLTDEDRIPWFHQVGRAITERTAEGPGCVTACSALKRRYRDLLRGHVPDLVFVYLRADVADLRRRLATRRHEFMSPSLLESQLATLEHPAADEGVLSVDTEDGPEETVRLIRRLIEEHGA